MEGTAGVQNKRLSIDPGIARRRAHPGYGETEAGQRSVADRSRASGPPSLNRRPGTNWRDRILVSAETTSAVGQFD